MSDAISREEVAKVARLARLRLSDDELETFTEQLGQILEHARDVNALDLDDLEATSHPFHLVNVMRDDVVTAGVDRAAILAMAPDAREDRFAVPRIVGEAP